MSQPIILASASPRRKALLGQIGIDCEVIPSEIDERPFEDEHPLNYVRRMAAEKAMAITERYPERIVLGADTDVIVDERILGKPADRDDFIETFSLLSGRSHQVISAVCVMRGEEGSLMISISEVEFRDVSEQQMRDYWDSGEPRDKAGGYGIQGLGAIFVRNIQGSYSGIMGLPLYETSELLREAGVAPLQGTA
jgi:septum formation protein